MTDIAAANVTHTFLAKDRRPAGKHGYVATGYIAFGNGTLTYPAYGIPLTKSKMGMPHVISSLKVLGSSVSGYAFDYDMTNTALRLLVEDITTGNTSASNLQGVTGAFINTAVGASGVIQLANAAANTSYNIGKLKEIGNLAVAAINCHVEITGY